MISPIDSVTPGPWTAKSDHSVKSLAPGHWAVSGPCTGRRREANARAISAVPELIDLARHVDLLWAALGDPRADVQNFEALEGCARRAREALVKIGLTPRNR